ncbi:MAG: biliverdin-producing heme oxygenase [Ktedonobacteraceae bacterium]|nr:biliverdin-producing heme oxygenase [Ktedonobacteraceae bacterium]
MFLASLKEATQALHRKLEHDVDIFHTITTLESYSRLLQKFLGFYLPVEPRLLGVQNRYDLQVHLRGRLKSPLLLRDLSEIAAQQVTGVPLCETLPTLTCPAHVWGCLYVLEGSTLGGTLISKHITRELGLTAEHGCAFFGSYGSQVGSMWQMFTCTLEAYVSTHHEEQIIIASACETFAVLSQWLLKE